MSENTAPSPADVAPKAAPEPAQNVGTPSEPVQLPDDHPLVKTLAAMKGEVQSLKAKASRLDELEEASKTAEQKAAERLADAERRAAELEAKATLAEVAAKSGHPGDILAGPADQSAKALQAFADRLTAYLQENTSDRLRRGNVAPAEGKTPPAVNDERAAFADYLTGRR